jgi:hypothetical protein
MAKRAQTRGRGSFQCATTSIVPAWARQGSSSQQGGNQLIMRRKAAGDGGRGAVRTALARPAHDFGSLRVTGRHLCHLSTPSSSSSFCRRLRHLRRPHLHRRLIKPGTWAIVVVPVCMMRLAKTKVFMYGTSTLVVLL